MLGGRVQQNLPLLPLPVVEPSVDAPRKLSGDFGETVEGVEIHMQIRVIRVSSIETKDN